MIEKNNNKKDKYSVLIDIDVFDVNASFKKGKDPEDKYRKPNTKLSGLDIDETESFLKTLKKKYQ